jgi:hypothetical protein
MLKQKAIQGFCALAFAALCLAPVATAQTNVPVTLTSAGGYSEDGIYVSPYYATVNGAQNTAVTCDDFKDNSWVGSTWNANITSFSSLSATNLPTAWGNALGVSASTFNLYEEAAWLTLQLVQQTPGSQNQINYSYAVWAVFDPTGVANFLDNGGHPSSTNIALCNAIFGSGNCGSHNITGGLLGGAQGTAFYNGEFSNVFVISPLVGNSLTVCNAESGNCPAQEFLEVVPEGGAALAYLLMAGLCCFGAMYVKSRRRMTPMATA